MNTLFYIILQLNIPDVPDLSNVTDQEGVIILLSWILGLVILLSTAVVTAFWLRDGKKDETIQKLNDRNYEILTTTNVTLARCTDVLTSINSTHQSLPSDVRSEVTLLSGVIEKQHDATRSAIDKLAR
mgnify:CR=1 FL=1